MVSCDRPRLLEKLARTVREAVARDFKRSPETIMLAFTLKGQVGLRSEAAPSSLMTAFQTATNANQLG